MPVSTGALVPVVTDKGPEIRESTEPSKSGKALVGIIYPPPEIRNIVDKTASFVSRNGPEFEVRIRQHEANNPRFNFLTPTDPYHTYYQHKVKEFAEGKAVEPSAAAAKPSAVTTLPQKVQDAIKAAEFIPKEPPAEFEFMADPATINAFDLDLIKLTATFVARNGRQFLTQLMTRESRNYQFDFLKPQHSNFGYFTKLVEQYTKILIPPKDMAEKLRKETNDPKNILDDVKYRVEWEKHQRRIREREEAEIEKERVAYAQIDWHDFVVVQTVDFQPHETANLPPPCNPKDVGARLLAQQRLEATKLSAQTMEMEVESGSEDETEGGGDDEKEKGAKQRKATIRDQSEKQRQGNNDQKSAANRESSHDAGANQQQKAKMAQDVSQPVPAPPNPENVVIRKDYNPRTKQLEKVKQSEQKWVISPLTGEKILADKLQEHMRFNTVDSQYYVQKEREMQDKQEEEPVFAPGMDITANINYFAERRSDIFGVGSRGAEQVMIGKKLGEDERPKVDPKAIWDGHTASVDATTKAAQSHVTIEEQIAQIHRAQGLLPDQEKERIGPKSTGGGGASSISEKIAPPLPPKEPQPPKPPAPPAAPPRPPMPTPAALPRPPPVPAAQAVRPTSAPLIPPTFAPNPTAAAYGVRPTMTATVVPVVQVTPTPVLLVQQPAIGMVGGFMPRQPYGGFGQPRAAPKVAPAYGGPAAQFKPIPQPQASIHASMVDDEPSTKRQKTSEDQLINEAEWLRKHGDKGPVAVAVQCPNVPDKPEWKLNGQTLNFTFSLRDTISALKSRIQEMTILPASKQKLVFEGLFVKDSQTLAFYNMLSGSVVQLQLKERGGRKK